MLYPYAVYPALLAWMDRRQKLKDIRSGFRPMADLPKVCVIVSAYNEEKDLLQKLQNFKKYDYPRDRLRLIVASDGSTDRTVEIAREFSKTCSQVEVVEFAERQGKVRVLNQVIEHLDCDYLIFSDANVLFDSQAVLKLIEPFSHPFVGVVCGKLLLMDVDTGASRAESAYWRLENWLKEREGKVGAALGANGAIFAMRRDLWTGCPSDLLVEDFYVPMKLLCEGWWNYFQPEALAYEYTPPTLKDEFKRRIRIGAGAYQILFRLWREQCHLSPFAAFAYLSHKVMRWLAPFFLLIQILSGLGAILVFWPNRWAVLAVMVAAIFLWMGPRIPKLPVWTQRLLLMLQQFLGMNLALLFGFSRYLRNSQQVTWERTAR